MTQLNSRQQTKVKAALSLIAVHGHNPRPVQQAAQAMIAKGTPASAAYVQALENFTQNIPGLGNTIALSLNLIQNSDAATVAVYDKALTAYNNTGDSSHLDNLGPMILEDAKALAIRDGSLSDSDAANWDIGDALGYSEAAFAETPAVPDAHTAAPGQTLNSQFQFAGGVGKAQPKPAPTQPAQAPQAAPGWGPTGFSPKLAQEAQRGPQTGRSMVRYDPFKGNQDVTGIRVGLTGDAARMMHGTPTGSIKTIQTATGVRIAPTGEQARREAGVPLGPEA